MKLATSILNMEKETQYLKELENTTTDYIHLDIMDGKFVTNKIEMYDFIMTNSPIKKPLDIHLMVEDVIPYIEKYSKLQPEYMTIHYEINGDIKEALTFIKSKNCKAGLSIKPSTPVEVILPYVDQIDLLLIMSVEPGYGKQSYIDISHKLSFARTLQSKYNFVIEVDGGINNITIASVDTDIAVVGSYITLSNNFQKQIDILREIC